MKKRTFTLAPILIGLIVIGVFAFAIENMRDLLFGSPLEVATASDGTTLTEGFLPVVGKAKHARSVTVNGRDIQIDRDGNFSDAVLLSPGYNVVEVALLDQFGKEKVKTYHLVLDESDTVAQVPTENRYQQ